MSVPELSIARQFVRRAGLKSWVCERRFPIHRVYCIGRNYREYAVEMGADPDREPPFFFQKPASAVVDTMSSHKNLAYKTVPYPPMTSDLQYEGELVVAIGKGGANLSVDDAKSCIFGYAVGCDLTRRDLQAEAKKLSRPWDTAKGFDDSAPCGPMVAKDDISITPESTLVLKVGTEIRQKGTLEQMIWSIPETISYLSRYFLLRPGDLIMTGTPAGVGTLHVGDVVHISCGSIPVCEFTVGPPKHPYQDTKE